MSDRQTADELTRIGLDIQTRNARVRLVIDDGADGDDATVEHPQGLIPVMVRLNGGREEANMDGVVTVRVLDNAADLPRLASGDK